jgi:hypothetical protein
MRVVSRYDGRVYEFGPELWGDLNLPRDHSGWARSVRWSCGRPGARVELNLDWFGEWFAEYAATMRATERASVWSWAALAVTPPASFVKITAT